MARHPRPICFAPGLRGMAQELRCMEDAGHAGPHRAEVTWELPDADEAPTQKLPPVRDSIGARRQPPALRALPPGSAELLHLIADALKADEDLADDTDALSWPPCEAGMVQGRECRWPTTGHPCLGYGSTGCGMKAQECRP